MKKRKARVNHTYYKIIFLIYYFDTIDLYINRNGAVEFLYGSNIVEFNEYKSCEVFGALKSLSRRKISHQITTCIKHEYIDEVISKDKSYLTIKDSGKEYLSSYPKELNKISNSKKIEKNQYFYKKL
ncbi:MAG: RQC domain-containing protein [Bacilli bacterium]